MFRYIKILPVLMAGLASCNAIHEFPTEEPSAPTMDVSVDITTTIRDITVVGETTISGSDVYPQTIDSDMELRMVAEFYCASNGELFSRQVIPLHSQSMSSQQSFPAQLQLEKYYVIIWREFVNKSSADKSIIYCTEKGLRNVTLINPNVGNMDEMDCCYGLSEVDLTTYAGKGNVQLEIPVEIKRPVAKYILITNDVAVQIGKLMQTRGLDASKPNLAAQARSVIGEYKCKVIYQGNGLYGFDCYTGRPNDAKAGMYFYASFELLNENEARIAFSYPFAFPEGNTIHVTLQIFDENGSMIQEVPNVSIPVKQGELTVLKSDFLTHEYPQGIAINQEYDGVFDIRLPD